VGGGARGDDGGGEGLQRGALLLRARRARDEGVAAQRGRVGAPLLVRARVRVGVGVRVGVRVRG